MTTTTAQAPVTEAEIREAIAGGVLEALGDLVGLLSQANALGPIVDSTMARTREPDGWGAGFNPEAGHPGTLWADLTADEGEELEGAVVESIDLDRLASIIVDDVVSATLAWAQRHPDAPRGRYAAATA